MHGFYRAKIHSDGVLEKIIFRILVTEDLTNKELVGYTCSPKASMITLEHFLAYVVKYKAIVHQLYFIGELLQRKVKNTEFFEVGQ